MDDVGRELVEDPAVVGDDDDAELGAGPPDLFDAAGDDPQPVDVEAGVGLVEDRELGLEERHLQDLVALLLAAGEAVVEVALGEAEVHAEALEPLAQLHADLEHRDVACRVGRATAWRRNCETGTPGISSGYWKARNMPGLARASGAQAA